MVATCMRRRLVRKAARIRLRSEIFVLTAVICILQALLVGLAIWRIDTKALFEREKGNLTQLLNVVNHDIESRVESVNSIALDVVINSEIKSRLNRDTPLEAGRAKIAVNSILSKKVISASDDLLDLSIIDLRNNTYSTRAMYFLPPAFRLEESEVFKRAAEWNGALVWLEGNSIIERYSGDTIFPNTPMGGLRAAAVIKDYTRSEVLGLLMVSVKDDFFSGIDYSDSKLESVGMYMVCPDGGLVLPVAGTARELHRDIVARVDRERESDAFIMPDPEKTVVSYLRNEAMGWTLVSTTPSASINRSFSYIIKTLVAALALSLFASILVSWLSTELITRGIGDLAEKMRLVEQGDFDVQVNSLRRDEIGWLSRVFDQMVQHIKRLIERTYKLQLLTQEAEFRALQSQINPHFLYNALDMINWRLLAAGQDEISKSVVGLGMILQYSMSAEAVVTLEQELQNVEDYLTLRKSNNDPEFESTVEVEGGRDVRLPKLTLQPLVENAIVHGFGRRRSGNELAIRAFPLADGMYRIEVRDNGIGMDADTLAAILSNDRAAGGRRREARMHIGMKNVDERLKYMYGPSCGLSVASEFGAGTTVSVTVPADGVNAREAGDEP